MRVLICPDSFSGTLTAAEAAAAIAQGFAAGRPEIDLRLLPLSDGGPGFCEALAVSLGGELRRASVIGPAGQPVEAAWLQVGRTAYVESAAACGLQLQPRASAMRATSYGVGQLLVAAAADCDEVVVGLGGTSVSDAGMGLIAALGGRPFDAADPLCRGAAGLSDIEEWPEASWPESASLTFATDVDVPLLGSRGAAQGFAPQKGASAEEVERIESAHERIARMAPSAGKPAHLQLGAGAGGGIGFALTVLGAKRVSGAELVLEAAGLRAAVAEADLVITGEGRLDWQSEAGKVVAVAAAAAAALAKPAIAICGDVELTRRECQQIGLAAAYSMSEMYGIEASLGRPAQTLAAAAGRLARTWAR